MQRRKLLVLTMAVAVGMALTPATALAEDTIHITVKTLTGKNIEIYIKPSAKILEIKKAIMNKEGIPTEMQRLILSGRQLEDTKTLHAYNIVEGTRLHLILRLK